MKYIILIALIFALLAPTVRAANEDFIPFAKTPTQAVNEIFGPVKDSFWNAVNLVKNAVLWIWELILPIWRWIDNWFKATTGLTIPETFDIIGKFFVSIVDDAERFIRWIISIIPGTN